MSKHLVIVESPTKAKTLKKFLGSDYIIESSIGHIRDLPANAAEIPKKFKKESWARLGVDVDNDFKPLYIVQPAKRKKIAELKDLLSKVDDLLLATDEDREGEAISWHLVEVLSPDMPIKRMVFHEITKPAVLEALENTREIDQDLVHAQEARRITDRLYGYEVSPILWRKIGPRLSAGRVQSVAIRMLVEREQARMRFRVAEYWDLVANFETAEKKNFDARLVSVEGKRIASGKDFDPDSGKLKRDDVHLLDGDTAAKLRSSLEAGEFAVLSAEEKPFTRSPAPPFTTSSLQQEGNRKLRFDAKRTMRAAQRLYENGFITYMRTDSVSLSDTAIDLCRKTIEKTYGPAFLPSEPRRYKAKVKNAQEAHEAIRVAGDSIAPVSKIRTVLGEDEAKIYDLIWKRTLACQMKDAVGRRMTLRVQNQGGDAPESIFQATGTVIDFPGFLRAFVSQNDDPDAALSEQETILPPVKEGESLRASKLECEEHHTTPPARMTEASLVKALEESGIGRPSTYASIIETIQRQYTFKKGTALVPNFTAFAVVSLMIEHLTDLIDPRFTAKMEDRLDAISRGEDKALAYLKDLYNGNGAPGLHPLVEEKTEGIDARQVCSIPIGQDDKGLDVIVRVGRYGPFVQREEETAPIPDQTCPDELTVEYACRLLDAKARGEEPLGEHPESSLPIFVKTGRFGPYVQLGVADPDNKKEKPKMVSLLKGMSPETLDFDTAVRLLSLPRVVGQDADGVDVVAYNGRYGPYIKRGDDTRSLTADDDLLELGMPRALELLAQEKQGRGARSAPKQIKSFDKVAELGDVEVKLLAGRYGPYVTDGETNASLPRGFENPEGLTLSLALELLEQQRERKGRKKAAKKKAKKAPPKKKAAKKTAKKATAKKASKSKATKKASKKAAKKTTKKKSTSKKASE